MFREEMRQELGYHEICTERNFAKSLTMLKLEHKVEYIIMGSRKSDPYCQGLDVLAPSDIGKGYPSFVRVNPILNWSYEMVWEFIKGFGIPYCGLYEQGYTYLGNKSNTTKN